MFGKQKVATILAEFLGTTVLATVTLAMIERTSFPFFLALTVAITYVVMWSLYGTTRAVILNPAMTVGLWTLRKLQTSYAVVYIAAQMLGGLVAWRLVEYFQKTALTNIAGKNFDWRVLIAEAIGAFIFGMGIAAAMYNHNDNLKKSITIGGALFLGVTVASFAGNALLNPAVALGVRSLNWAYGVGPIVGAVIGMNLYGWLFAPSVETVVHSARVTPVGSKALPVVVGKKNTAKPLVKKSQTKVTPKTK
ncbi:MAG: hypothetical protein NVS1B7_6620 [Candidatus Saccharimonadales bacterium]